MCGVFGFLSYGKGIKGLRNLAESLGDASTARGTHATGVSFISKGKVVTKKKGVPSWSFDYSQIPGNARAVLGHTRHTTQGSQKKNYNNHPFGGSAGGMDFALAHNGILYNDYELQKQFMLPVSKIETDSYVAAQLIEFKDEFSIESIKWMAEQVEGMFVFTILDREGNMYFVKNDNPLTIAHFKELGLYVYASTQKILLQGLSKFDDTVDELMDALLLGNTDKVEVIQPKQGQILKINALGELTWARFKPSIRSYYTSSCGSWGKYNNFSNKISTKGTNAIQDMFETEVIKTVTEKDVRELAHIWGVSQTDLDLLIEFYELDDIYDAIRYGYYYEYLDGVWDYINNQANEVVQ